MAVLPLSAFSNCSAMRLNCGSNLRTTTLRMPNGDSVWGLFVNGYGPTKALAASIDPGRREQLKRDFIAFHEQYRSDLGIAMPRDYLVTIGYRR
jgi:hypothetical protein